MWLLVATQPKKTLGELRNISISLSNGVYICQWDDDDYYSPLRLYEQFINAIMHNKKGCILDRWLLHDTITDSLYLAPKRNWEGSLLCEKSIFANIKYPHISRGEDSVVVEKLVNFLHILSMPELYTYKIHANNTFDRDHFNGFIQNSIPINKNEYMYKQ